MMLSPSPRTEVLGTLRQGQGTVGTVKTRGHPHAVDTYLKKATGDVSTRCADGRPVDTCPRGVQMATKHPHVHRMYSVFQQVITTLYSFMLPRHFPLVLTRLPFVVTCLLFAIMRLWLHHSGWGWRGHSIPVRVAPVRHGQVVLVAGIHSRAGLVLQDFCGCRRIPRMGSGCPS